MYRVYSYNREACTRQENWLKKASKLTVNSRQHHQNEHEHEMDDDLAADGLRRDHGHVSAIL